MRTSHGYRKLAVESAALGIGYAALLIWIGSALVGSFGYDDKYPYWPAIGGLRTDTAGAIAFGFAIVFLVLSKYLQLRRRTAPVRPVARGAGVLTVQAMAETGVVLGTALVLYLSFNAVTHPETLRMQLTHFAPWPTEGTVRVIALAVCLVGVALRRYLRATAVPAGQAAPPLSSVRVPSDEASRV